MTTPILTEAEMPALPEAATCALIQGIQGSEYRSLSPEFAPGCAMYSPEQMHAYGRAVEAAVLAKLAAMNEPAASIYVSADGAREFDDWRVPLPEGRNELFTHPPAAQDREDAERWRAVRDHWKSAQMHFRKDASNLLRSITMTIDFDHRSSGAREIEREFDAALKGTP